MTPLRWQRVKDVFTAASALPRTDWPAYVEQACGEDAELAAEVASLLAAHAREDAVIDRPAAAHVSNLAAVAADRWIGRRIGPYEIEALVGRGGMGEVYRARRSDAQYEKEVAIKLVPGGYHAAFVLERLRAERQILAGLEHPHIARLIDGGAADDGTPYMVMEFVDGMPIDRYCKQRKLPLRERLRLFRDVCSAVSYAHQRLVVHRDLKPGNILVTDDGGVKLLDFGIAKVLQPTVGDGSGVPAPTLMQALTPQFSSPEQILGRPVTTASDVYSLGVVLYVLLTGRSPYRSALDSTQDAIREVCDTQPLRPSAALPAAGQQHGERLDHDLDAIVLQALRKEPEQRYASVEQLSDDIRCYLAGLPVKARGDETGYRARKFLRRHRFEAAAAALMAFALVGGTIVSLREARIATEQERLADEQRARAERHFASVRQLADTFMFRVHDEIENLPGSTAARELLVTTALEYLNTLAAEADRDPSLQQELAAAFEKVADIQGRAYRANTGEPRAALESYTKAIALLEPLVAADPANTRARSSLAQDYLEQSQLLLLLGDAAAALTGSQRAVAMFEELAATQPATATRRSLAAAYGVHAYTVDMAGGQRDGSVVYAKQAVAIFEDLLRQSPEDLELAFELGVAYGRIGTTIAGENPLPDAQREALEFHRKALAVDERLVAATQGANTSYVRALLGDRLNVSLELYELGDYSGAVEIARAGLPLLSSLAADADNAQVAVDGANLGWPLGHALLATGELAEAASLFEQHWAVLEEVARKSDTLKVQFLLGAMAYGLGTVHSQHAVNGPPDRSTRLEQWRRANGWYDQAVTHFGRVTAKVTLDYMDQRTVDEAAAGLARSTAELATLVASPRL